MISYCYYSNLSKSARGWVAIVDGTLAVTDKDGHVMERGPLVTKKRKLSKRRWSSRFQKFSDTFGSLKSSPSLKMNVQQMNKSGNVLVKILEY